MASFRGYPCCSCLAKWLPAYEKELLRRGVIRFNLDVFQLIGGAKASAGTHSNGGAFDIGQMSDETILVARQMGADATWARTRAQGFSLPHTHGVLRGCRHNKPARYQIAAVDAGFNGLGLGGRAGEDDGPRPLSKRSWRAGIRWAKRQARVRRRWVQSYAAVRPAHGRVKPGGRIVKTRKKGSGFTSAWTQTDYKGRVWMRTKLSPLWYLADDFDRRKK